VEPFTIAAVLGPLLVEGGRAVISRFIAPDKIKPVSVTEAIQLMQAETERFKVINDAGGTNPTYFWVEAVIRLQRPFVVIATFGAWAAALSGLWSPAEYAQENIANFAAAVGFYLFGDRTLTAANGKFRTK
jgi:hypothetical protein